MANVESCEFCPNQSSDWMLATLPNKDSVIWCGVCKEGRRAIFADMTVTDVLIRRDRLLLDLKVAPDDPRVVLLNQVLADFGYAET
ncbi:MAG: hypothetical protein NVSMB39_6870 [Candidatus Saccharimonadales bacterium]